MLAHSARDALGFQVLSIETRVRELSISILDLCVWRLCLLAQIGVHRTLLWWASQSKAHRKAQVRLCRRQGNNQPLLPLCGGSTHVHLLLPGGCHGDRLCQPPSFFLGPAEQGCRM